MPSATSSILHHAAPSIQAVWKHWGLYNAFALISYFIQLYFLVRYDAPDNIKINIPYALHDYDLLPAERII